MMGRADNSSIRRKARLGCAWGRLDCDLTVSEFALLVVPCHYPRRDQEFLTRLSVFGEQRGLNIVVVPSIDHCAVREDSNHQAPRHANRRSIDRREPCVAYPLILSELNPATEYARPCPMVLSCSSASPIRSLPRVCPNRSHSTGIFRMRNVGMKAPSASPDE